MSKRKVAKTSFNGGVQSPLLQGMVDSPKGASSFQASDNMIPLKYGPITRRGGTEFVSETVGNSGADKRVQLVPFNYNDTDSYILEFSALEDNRMKVYKDKGLVLEGAQNLNQGIDSIPSGGPAPLVVNVDGDGTAYTVGAEVVISGLSEATYLNNRIFTVDAVSASTVTLNQESSTVAETSPGGTLSQVFEITIPYSASDMFKSDGTFRLDFRQYNDVMYIVHPDYAPRILTRSADNAWTITIADMEYGPYLPDNVDVELKLDATLWSDTNPDKLNPVEAGYQYTTVTTRQGAFYEDNGTFNLFASTDVGRKIAMFVAQLYNDAREGREHRWHFLEIDEFIDETKVVLKALDKDAFWTNSEEANERHRPHRFLTTGGYKRDTGCNQWALGAFSDTTGHPSVIEIHDGRVCMGNTTEQPSVIHFSQIGRFDTTSIGWKTVDDDGQTYDDFGFNVSIGAGNASPIKWINSIASGLAVATYSSIGVIAPNNTGKGFVPGNVFFRKSGDIGAKSIQPESVDAYTLFSSRTGRRLYGLRYDVALTSQRFEDLSERAEHVSRAGIIDFAFQREPIDTLWCVLSDGKLIAFTFDENNEIDAWHQHSISGDKTKYDNNGVQDTGIVRSVASIPSSDGLSDEIWIAVDRIDPTTGRGYGQGVRRTVEVLSSTYRDEGIVDAKLMDCHASIVQTSSECSINAAALKKFSSTAHTLSTGDIIFLSNFSLNPGILDKNDTTAEEFFNNTHFRVTGTSANSFDLETLAGNDIDATFLLTLFPEGETGPALGKCDYQPTTTDISAFGDIYGGSTVDLYIDGRYYQGQDINESNTTTINNGVYGANITAGYPYTSYVELKNLEGSGLQDPDQGKTKRVLRLFVRILDSLGLKYGDSSTNMIEYEFDEDDSISDLESLKSGDYILDFDGGYEKSGTVRLQGDGPYPLMIQTLVVEMDVQDYVSNQ